jgi:hypothetical protein
VIVAPVGIVRMAVERAVAAVMVVSAVAAPLSADRQKTSGDVSLVWFPQLPTVPTTGVGTCDDGRQSCPSVLPIRMMSPVWFA